MREVGRSSLKSMVGRSLLPVGPPLQSPFLLFPSRDLSLPSSEGSDSRDKNKQQQNRGRAADKTPPGSPFASALLCLFLSSPFTSPLPLVFFFACSPLPVFSLLIFFSPPSLHLFPFEYSLLLFCSLLFFCLLLESFGDDHWPRSPFRFLYFSLLRLMVGLTDVQSV